MPEDEVKDGTSNKRRKLMIRPDGFAISKPVDTPKHNIPVPKFTSAFNEVPQVPQRKPPLKSNNDMTPFNVPKPTSFLSHKHPAGTLRQLTVPTVPLRLKEKELKERPSASPLRVIPIPDPHVVVPREPPSAAIPNLQLRSVPLQPPVLSQVVAPKNGIPLNELPLPPTLHSSDTTNDKRMRTISTTEIALATDLSTDNGTAELAHIFLHDQHPDIAASDKEAAPEWNIGMSPQKGSKFIKGKGKEAKFVRGGLAARASELMTRSRTSLALWQKEIELQLATSSLVNFNPHLRLRIIKISNVPLGVSSGSPRKRNPVGVSPGTAFCRVTLTGHTQTKYNTMEKKDYLVVFSFPTVAPPRLKGKDGIYVRNPEDFVVGHEVCVWEPWLEVPLPFQPFSGDVPLEDTEDLTAIQVAPFPMLPSTYPQPSSSPQPMEQDLRHVNTALLISRFVILPRTNTPSP